MIALRTCAENKVRTAQEIVAIPKRDQKSTIPLCADQEFSQHRIPFANRTVLERREKQTAAQKFGRRPRTLVLFSLIKFTPIKRVPRGKLGNRRTLESPGSTTARRSPRQHSFMECRVAWVQCRELRTAQLRTANYVPQPTYRLAALTRSEYAPRAHANPAVFALTPNPKSANPLLLDETASHFQGIGVPSAQRSGSVSGHLRLKQDLQPLRGAMP